MIHDILILTSPSVTVLKAANMWSKLSYFTLEFHRICVFVFFSQVITHQFHRFTSRLFFVWSLVISSGDRYLWREEICRFGVRIRRPEWWPWFLSWGTERWSTEQNMLSTGRFKKNVCNSSNITSFGDFFGKHLVAWSPWEVQIWNWGHNDEWI